MQFERKLYKQEGSGLDSPHRHRSSELHGGELTIDSIPHRKQYAALPTTL